MIEKIAGVKELKIEQTSGVYFLMLNGELVYIGQSIDVVSRVCDHFEAKAFDRVFYIDVPCADLLRVESALIRYFDPPLNGGCVSFSDESRDAAIIDALFSTGLNQDPSALWRWQFGKSWKLIGRAAIQNESRFPLFADPQINELIRRAAESHGRQSGTRIAKVLWERARERTLKEVVDAGPRPRNTWRDWAKSSEATFVYHARAILQGKQ